MCIRDSERGAYRRDGGRFEPISPLLPDDGMTSFAQDPAGNLWVGTVNNGLLRLGTVSYTHLDVYKRQKVICASKTPPATHSGIWPLRSKKRATPPGAIERCAT